MYCSENIVLSEKLALRELAGIIGGLLVFPSEEMVGGTNVEEVVGWWILIGAIDS